MTSYFQGKKILITGANRGLGHELALQAAHLGTQVIALGRGHEGLDSLQKQGITTLACDITNPQQMTDVFGQIQAKHGTIDILVLNAGVKHDTPGILDAEKIRDTFEVNFFGTLRCVELALPLMNRTGQGQIVFISSLGCYHGMIQANGYNASKAAVTILAESLRMDFAMNQIPISVMVVKPGLIATSMIRESNNYKMMILSKEKTAATILKGIQKKKKELCFPKLMHWVSVGMSLMPPQIQYFFFKRVKAKEA